LAVCSDKVDAAASQLTYGSTADTIDCEAGPTHGALVNSEIAEPQLLAPVANSAASSSRAVAAAAIIGSDPGPAYMRPELISGGSAPKSNTVFSSVDLDRCVSGLSHTPAQRQH
jgi:hypothetical protein